MTDKPIRIRGLVPRRLFLQGGMAVAAGALVRPRVARSLSALPMLQTEQVVDVTDPRFGAVGDGVTNDRAAFQAAIDFAISRRRVLWIPEPAQSYRIVLDPTNDRLEINGRLVIRGDGSQRTLLNFGIQDPDLSKIHAGFLIPNGINVEMSGLRLEEDVLATEFDFAGVFIETGPEKHNVLIEDVVIDGFTHCIYCPSGGDSAVGELFLTIRRCDLSPHRQYCLAFWASETGHKRLHIYDSYLHDNTESHLVYCHPHNTVHVENTRFDGATSWAFHFQGSSVGGDPEYQRFIGCWFGPRNQQSLITQSRAQTYTLVEVRNCVFEGRPAIQIRSDILIDGCYFTTPLDPPSGTNFIGAYSNAPWKARITNCIFAARANSQPDIELRLEGIEVTIENCQFYNQHAGTFIAMGSSSLNKYDISNCLFYSRSSDDTQTTCLDINDGQVSVRRCRFVGKMVSDRGVLFFRAAETGPGPEARIQIDDCLFNAISGGSLFHVEVTGATSWSERIFGNNNRITNLITAKPLITTDPDDSAVYGYLNPVSGSAPAPLTAGPTVVINSNFDQYDVFGSADVSFIHWWYPDGLSDPLFSGVVTLTASSGFTLVAGGNIDLGGSTSRAVATGAEVRLFYEPSDATWTVVN